MTTSELLLVDVALPVSDIQDDVRNTRNSHETWAQVPGGCRKQGERGWLDDPQAPHRFLLIVHQMQVLFRLIQRGLTLIFPTVSYMTEPFSTKDTLFGFSGCGKDSRTLYSGFSTLSNPNVFQLATSLFAKTCCLSEPAM